MSNGTYYIYNPNRSLTRDEQLVIQKGYPFVSTTMLGRRGAMDPIDRLNDHRHHSENTHFIVRGSIEIAKARDDAFRTRPKLFQSGQWADMPARVDYRGEAGDQGCVFVEGHKSLSPTTAERFVRRGTLCIVPKNTPGAFTTS